jgi:deoxynucleoside kinase
MDIIVGYSELIGLTLVMFLTGLLMILLNIAENAKSQNNTKNNTKNNENKNENKNEAINPIKKKPIVISIEGNIGTGKSTLIEHLQEKFTELYPHVNIGYIPEPVNVWSSVTDKNGMTILEKYYENQHKYAFSFQMMAYISRLSIIRKALLEDNDIIIMERSIFTDCEVFAKMLYADGKIEEIEYNIYMKWFNEFIGDLPNIWHIYIQAEPTVSASRVVKRGRPGENIPLSYLETCHDYHENWLLTNQTVPTLLLDGNKKMQEADYAEWLEQIADFISIYKC